MNTSPVTNILIFEDASIEKFMPMVFLTPFYDLPLGHKTNLERLIEYFPTENINLHCRPYLKETVKQNHPGILVNVINASVECLLINARIQLNPEIVNTLKKGSSNQVWINLKQEIVAARLNHQGIALIQTMLSKQVIQSKSLLPELQKVATLQKTSTPLIDTPWELLSLQADYLNQDFQKAQAGGDIRAKIHAGSELIRPDQIMIGAHSVLGSHTVLDASAGPIWIDEQVIIKPFTYIQGPAVIGRNTYLDQANIQNSMIGKNNKISGHIKNSWLLDHNQVGYLAHIQNSWIGHWNEIGSQTLVNNHDPLYKPISIQVSRTRKVDTQQTYLGCLMGSYCSIAPQSIIPCGFQVESGCLYQSMEPDCYLPPFSLVQSPRLSKLRPWAEIEYGIEQLYLAQKTSWTEVEKSTLKERYQYFSN